MRGTVSRFIGDGVGFARLVDVSNVSVFELVDMAQDLAAKRTARKKIDSRLLLPPRRHSLCDIITENAVDTRRQKRLYLGLNVANAARVDA